MKLTNQRKSNQMLLFEQRGKPEYPEKNLSEQSREPANSIHIRRRVWELNPSHVVRSKCSHHYACPVPLKPTRRQLEESSLLANYKASRLMVNLAKLVLTVKKQSRYLCPEMQVIREFKKRRRLRIRQHHEGIIESVFSGPDGNRKTTFRVSGQWCLPDFYTNHL